MQSIVLVATHDEEFDVLGAMLRRHRPSLSILPVRRRADLDALSRRDLTTSRVIAFCSDVLVPGGVLDAIGFGAYNFHPGPPSYPGWAPASFAVYQGARVYGVTAHVMARQADSGDIVGTHMFDVPSGTHQAALEGLAYSAALQLFQHFALALATCRQPLPTLPTAWGGRRYTRRDHAAMCEIRPDIGAEELERRVSAFGAGPPDHRPVIKLHGFTFALLDTGDRRP